METKALIIILALVGLIFLFRKHITLPHADQQMTPREIYAAGWKAGQLWAAVNIGHGTEMIGDYMLNSGWEEQLKNDTLKIKQIENEKSRN